MSLFVKLAVFCALVACITGGSCNQDFADRPYSCCEESSCYYGCLMGSCWKQCDGVGSCASGYSDSGSIEWCWLADSPACSVNADCAGLLHNGCAGDCSVEYGKNRPGKQPPGPVYSRYSYVQSRDYSNDTVTIATFSHVTDPNLYGVSESSSQFSATPL